MLTTCSGILQLLKNTDPNVKCFALKRLKGDIHLFWTELLPHLPTLEALYEDEALPETTRKLAAYVVSLVYYHLGSFEESVDYALHAIPVFNLHDRDTFTRTLVGKCVDCYINLRRMKQKIPRNLEQFFTELFTSWNGICCAQSPVEMLGLAISTRRIDFVQCVLNDYIRHKTSAVDILSQCVHIALNYIHDIDFRREVLRCVVQMYQINTSGKVDYFSLMHCLLFLNDPSQMVSLIASLVSEGASTAPENVLIAFQIAFEIFQFGSQEFVTNIIESLSKADVCIIKSARLRTQLLTVLSGSLTTELFLKFCYSQCRADVHVLNQVKKSIEGKNSVTHNALIIANSYIYTGTTIDGFLRENLEWLRKATNWSKFTATASVGAIHKGHIGQGMHILEPYLPQGPSRSPYQEGGALYGLGLIAAPLGRYSSASSRTDAQVDRDNEDILKYLIETLNVNGDKEQIVHGGALGIGLTAMGLRSEKLYDTLFSIMSCCDAVAGEGCAVGIGLVMLGSANTSIAEVLLTHAREKDQKEKIIRGISMALALIFYGQEMDAWSWIEQLLADQDPWIRLGGCMMLAMAFAGSGNSEALERLLQMGVKDVNDEVRRAAIMFMGFLTFKIPQTCVDAVRLLHDSHNAHIRYGVAMALGISAAGTGLKSAVDLLWLMKSDTCDFVRQGVVLALSMVLMQKSEKEIPQVADFRTFISSKIVDRHEDTCTKFGCILATGILDAGGRNAVIALHHMQHNLSKSIVTLFLFTQYWYWFPYSLMISVTFQPTCFIGLNQNLSMPKCSVFSNAPPSRFAPPKSLKQEKKESKKENLRVQLSTTKKEMARQHQRKQHSLTHDSETSHHASSMTANSPSLNTAPTFPSASNTITTADGCNALPVADTNVNDKNSPESEWLENPARVTTSQLEFLQMPPESVRFIPVKKKPWGICMLIDTKPSEACDLVSNIVPLTGDENESGEPDPPEPFTWP